MSSITVDSENAYDNVNTENLKTASDKGKKIKVKVIHSEEENDDKQDIKNKDDGKKKKTAIESTSEDNEKTNASKDKNCETK